MKALYDSVLVVSSSLCSAVGAIVLRMRCACVGGGIRPSTHHNTPIKIYLHSLGVFVGRHNA